MPPISSDLHQCGAVFTGESLYLECLGASGSSGKAKIEFKGNADSALAAATVFLPASKHGAFSEACAAFNDIIARHQASAAGAAGIPLAQLGKRMRETV